MLLLPPLESLRFFEAAARHQSFARAGAELGVTPAAVGRRVGMLEKHLGLGEQWNRKYGRRLDLGPPE